MERNERGQSGQVVIAMAIIIPFIILQLAFLVNISLLVHQKIRLQNAVDAGTYSAAASLARDLNYIADLNFNIDEIWRGDDTMSAGLYNSSWEQSFERYLDDTGFNDIKTVKTFHNRYQNDYAEIIGEIQYTNKTALPRAFALGDEAARLTYYHGYEDLAAANPAKLMFESLFDNSTQGRGFMDYREHTIDRSISYAITSGSCDAVTDACAGYTTFTVTINTPIEKRNQIAFVGKATAEPGFVPIARERYSAEPWMMTAYAKAQPYGGSIGGLSGTYGVSLVPVGEINGTKLYH